MCELNSQCLYISYRGRESQLFLFLMLIHLLMYIQFSMLYQVLSQVELIRQLFLHYIDLSNNHNTHINRTLQFNTRLNYFILLLLKEMIVI